MAGAMRPFTCKPQSGGDAMLMAFSGQSTTLIHLGLPVTFEGDVLDPVRWVSFCVLRVQAAAAPQTKVTGE
jgi:hypothetical protein